MNSNTIPTSREPIITLATQALAGAIAIGETVGLKQNTATDISTDLYDLIGDPAAPEDLGKQRELNERLSAVSAAYEAQRTAVQNGVDYCSAAIGVLRISLGKRWNARWQAAGFTTGSLEVTSDPGPMLVEFRNYFRDHPDKEVAPINVTAARAELLRAALQAARLGVATARAARV